MNTRENDASGVKQRAVGKKTTVTTTTTTTRTSSGSNTPTVSTTKKVTSTTSSPGSSGKTKGSSSSSGSALAIVKVIVTAIVIIAAVSYPFLKEVATDLGLFMGPIVKLNTDLCRPVADLQSCEDIHIHHASGLAIMACGNTEGRKAPNGWFPPLGHLNKSAEPFAYQDNIVLYNPENGMHEIMEIENFPKDADRLFHGIDIFERSEKELTIFVINHRRTGSVIEVINYYIGETTMKYVETIQHELIITPNDIVALGPRSFYVSNDHKHLKGGMRIVEELFRRAWSNVIYYSPEKVLVAYEHVASANGMTANHDKSVIYLSACHGAGLHVLEPRDDRTLRDRDYIKFDFYSDNPSFDPATGAIFLAGHVQPLKLTEGMKTPNAPLIAPSKVIKISNNTGSDQFYGKKYKVEEILRDDGTLVSASTTAAIDRERGVMLIGTLSERGLLHCKFPKDA